MKTKKSILLISLLLIGVGYTTTGQTKQPDSVVIKVGESSSVRIVIRDKKDLETLKFYDFQALMNDMIKKLEDRDTSTIKSPSTEYLKNTDNVWENDPAELKEWDEDESEKDVHVDVNTSISEKRSYKRTYHSIAFDLGMNNYLEGGTGNFPDGSNALYTVRPWGSWYVGINSVLRTRVGGKFFLEWGGGISWYNFKFQKDNITISKDDVSVIFAEDLRPENFTKSKLTATYLNASLIPVIDFGANRRKPSIVSDNHGRSFRFGVGPYVGYRIDSYSKLVYNDSSNDKQKEHNHDNYYLNNIRYGLRLQLGFRSTDFFISYDMNDLFIENKGPKLNAFSFGVSL